MLITLFVAFIARIFLNKIAAKAKNTKNPWDDALISALHLPVRLLIWLIGISLSADLVAYYAHASINVVTSQIRAVGLIIIIAWFLIKLIKALETNVTNADESSQLIDATTASAIGKLLRAAIIITTALIVMQSLGYSVSG